ncbi:MAG: carboxypeptidase-like regulatory domain-containing protein [Planctomycetota bacterium]
MGRKPRIGAVVFFAIAVAALLVFALQGGEPAPFQAPAMAAAVAAPAGPPAPGRTTSARLPVLPPGVADALDPAGLAAGTGSLRVHGRHVDGALPAAGMNFIASAVSAPATVATARADDHGIAVFAGLPAGAYTVANDRTDPALTIEIVAGHATELEFPVGRGVRVYGLVVDQDALPLPRVAVRFGDYELAQTDDQGRFVALDLPVQGTLTAAAPGYALEGPLDLAQHRADTDGRIVLRWGACTVFGVVVDTTGNAIADATVELRAVGGRYTGSASTDSHGAFEIDGVAPCELIWRATAGHHNANSGTITGQHGARLRLGIALAPMTAEQLNDQMSPLWSRWR